MLFLAVLLDGLFAMAVSHVMGSFGMGLAAFMFGGLLIVLTLFHASLVQKIR